MAAALIAPASVDAACCYFSAKNADILQPAQKVFLTWDAKEKVETFTVQPKFEGNALDFGMVIPTPTQPKLNEMPRDFFKHLAVYTIMKRRESPNSLSALTSGMVTTGTAFGPPCSTRQQCVRGFGGSPLNLMNESLVPVKRRARIDPEVFVKLA